MSVPIESVRDPFAPPRVRPGRPLPRRARFPSSDLDMQIGTYIPDLARAVGLVLLDEKPAPYVYVAGKLCMRRLHLEPVTFADLHFPIGVRKDHVDLLHEIAHFQVCSRQRIELPDFGLGENDFSAKQRRAIVTKRTADHEEHLAFVLGFLHAGRLRHVMARSIDARLEETGHLTWLAFLRAPVTRTACRWLEAHGLLRKGQPTTATRHGRRWT